MPVLSETRWGPHFWWEGTRGGGRIKCGACWRSVASRRGWALWGCLTGATASHLDGIGSRNTAHETIYLMYVTLFFSFANAYVSTCIHNWGGMTGMMMLMFFVDVGGWYMLVYPGYMLAREVYLYFSGLLFPSLFFKIDIMYVCL